MTPFIRKKMLTTPFLSVQEIVERETVFSQAMMNDPVFSKNFYEWFEFYHKNQDKMHIYQVDASWAENTASCIEQLDHAMRTHLGVLFDQHSSEELLKMFPMPDVDQEAALKFIDYARWTWNRGHHNIGARFDFAISPDGNLFIYEVNADTPSMLFESMNVQNLMAEHLGDTHAQFNEMWEWSQNDPFVARDSVTGVFGYNAEGEDFGSTESISQIAANAGGAVYLSTITDLVYDHETVGKSVKVARNPFYMSCMPHLELDNIYLMLPWEEMVDSNPQAIKDWCKWCDTVRFFEPAWAWIMSHKAFFASMTSDTDCPTTFKHGGVVLDVESYLNPPNALHTDGYVSKPMIGRKSSGVAITQGSTTVKSMDQTYSNGPKVYQPYRPTITIDGARAMGTMWMYGSKAACLSFREFDGAILENHNERVIMHELVD